MQKSDAAVSFKFPMRIGRYVLPAVIFWTISIAVVLTWELFDEFQQMYNVAKSGASAIWRKEDSLFRWAAAHKGVFVSKKDTSSNASNDNDVSSSDKTLKLTNPALLMREAFPPNANTKIRQGRLTSLRPIDAQNKPDAWEERALKSFEAGNEEFASLENIDDAKYLRFMRPLIFDDSCKVCHEEEGRKTGEIRGGFSIAVPMDQIWNEIMPDVIHRIIGYGGMWLLGILGILVTSRNLHQQILRRFDAENKLQEANELLEKRVADRTAELAKTNDNLQKEIIDRRQAEQWLMESEQRFRGYFEQGMVGMAILSPEKEWIEVNERLCRMLGYSENELMLKKWDELTFPEDISADKSQFQRLFDGIASGFVLNRRFLRGNGKVLRAGLSSQCLRKTDGTIDHILVLIQDSPQVDHT
jgi:PAS domain S-box-containing protein